MLTQDLAPADPQGPTLALISGRTADNPRLLKEARRRTFQTQKRDFSPALTHTHKRTHARTHARSLAHALAQEHHQHQAHARTRPHSHTRKVRSCAHATPSLGPQTRSAC
eukprot:4585587-Pleurochrysis_carterae.AAC.1